MKDAEVTTDQIRKQLATIRRQLTPTYTTQASTHIAERIAQLPCLQHASTIAAYIAIASEVTLEVSIHHFHQQGTTMLLPCIDIPQSGGMVFASWQPQAELHQAGFGLTEPVITGQKDIVDIDQIDAVLVPLLGFTSDCYRIGWGKGYYDKYFASKQNRLQQSPWLIGVAYACQQDNRIQPQSWDVQLDMVVTEEGVFVANERN